MIDDLFAVELNLVRDLKALCGLIHRAAFLLADDSRAN